MEKYQSYTRSFLLPKLVSIDMKYEMHQHLHNFKHFGEENFLKALSDLACGKNIQAGHVYCVPQPKTIEEEVKISKRIIKRRTPHSTGKERRK